MLEALRMAVISAGSPLSPWSVSTGRGGGGALSTADSAPAGGTTGPGAVGAGPEAGAAGCAGAAALGLSPNLNAGLAASGAAAGATSGLGAGSGSATGAGVGLASCMGGADKRGLARTGSEVAAAGSGAGSGADGPLRVAMPSGVLNVGAEVVNSDGAWIARRGAFYRTARRLFEGFVYA